jgi:hypothetical protein
MCLAMNKGGTPAYYLPGLWPKQYILINPLLQGTLNTFVTSKFVSATSLSLTEVITLPFAKRLFNLGTHQVQLMTSHFQRSIGGYLSRVDTLSGITEILLLLIDKTSSA